MTRILIVEDENIVAMDIKNMLENLGYSVSGIASSGEEAIQKAAKTNPDLVLMDIMLKGKMDGVEAAEIIRSRFDIPVVYLTAYSDEKTLQRAKITEPYGYILKPFEERELHTNIEIALYKHKMERRLKEREQWLATTLKSIGDAVIATDTYGFVTYMNPVAEKLTGWREDEALGRDVREIFNTIDEETGRIPENIVTKALQGTIINPSDNTVLISSDGRKIPIDKSAAPIVDDKGNIIGAVLVFKDITERRIAEKTIKRRLEFEKTISNISSRFVGVFDMDFAINYSLREMGRLSGASRAYLFLFKEDRSIMEKTHEWCAEGVTPQMSCLRKLFSKKFPWWVEKINKGEVIHIDDVSKLPEEAKAEREMLKSQNIKSLIVLPLYIGDKPEGFIGFDNVIQTGRWSDEDLMLLCVFSGILGNAFERKRAEEELKRNFENLYKSMERTIHAMSKIFENTATKPSRFGRSPGI